MEALRILLEISSISCSIAKKLDIVICISILYLTIKRLVEGRGQGLCPVVSSLVNGIGVAGGAHFVTELAAVARRVQMFGLQMADHPLTGGALVAALPAAQQPITQFANQGVH